MFISAASAFVVFYKDAHAAEVLKAFRNDPLHVKNQKVEVGYTLDYEDNSNRRGAPKPSQQLVNRIRLAFNWNTENNISVKDLPAELEAIVPSTSFTNINSTLFCNEQHIVCQTFNESKESVDDRPPTIRLEDIPQPVTYTCNQVLKLHKRLHTVPINTAAKPSKAAKRKAAKKRENIVKIESDLDKRQNCRPLEPGMGRGFNQRTFDRRAVASSINQFPSQSFGQKPCAVICPTKRETEVKSEPIEHAPSSSKDTGLVQQPVNRGSGCILQKPLGINRGRGCMTITADMMKVIQKY